MPQPLPADESAPEEDRRGSAPSGKPADGDSKASRSKEPTLIARYGRMYFLAEFRHNLNTPPLPGKYVVVRTDRGVELAEVIAPVGNDGPLSLPPEQLKEYLDANGDGYPFRRGGRVLRLANHQDIVDHRHLQSSAEDEYGFCRQVIDELGLDMHLVTVEHLLGGERIVFYFTADQRVDFRELVRRLAAEYRTRIEMRQVGARDEARLVADMERCGRQCCCQRFLKELKPVSMRMAKVQKATLDPSKISGRCGRLMCCLRYEDAGYEQLRRKLPKRNTWARTETLVGKVRDTQILTQLVRLQLQDGTTAVVSNEEIIERDLRDPPPPQKRPERTSREDKPAPQSERTDAKSADGQSGGKSGRKRRRKRKKRKSGGGGQNQSASAAKGQSSQGRSTGKSKSRSSRRRKRRKDKGKDRRASGSGGGSSGSKG